MQIRRYILTTALALGRAIAENFVETAARISARNSAVNYGACNERGSISLRISCFANSFGIAP